MSLMTSLRAVPGLAGGGYGRVIGVQALAGGGTQAGGTRSALVTLEPLPSSFSSSFGRDLAQFSGQPTASGATTAALAPQAIVVVQQVPVTNIPGLSPRPEPEFKVKEDEAPEDDEKANDKADAEFSAALGQMAKDLGFGPKPLPELGEQLASRSFAPTDLVATRSFAPTDLNANLALNGDFGARAKLAAAAYAKTLATVGSGEAAAVA